METSGAHVLLFAYGSLMAASSRRESLPDYDDVRFPPRPARLRGFRKAFSAVYANDCRFSTGEGTVPTWVAYLNVEPDADAYAHGVLLTLTSDQFRRLELRESGYYVIDVRQNIEPIKGTALPLAPILVFSFPVSAEDGSARVGRIGVGTDYQQVVARACAEADAQLGSHQCSGEFAGLCERCAEWPQLVCSNARLAGKYR